MKKILKQCDCKCHVTAQGWTSNYECEKCREYVKHKGYFVVFVLHPSQPKTDSYAVNARRRKRHFSSTLEGKSLCNMTVQAGEIKLPWESPMQRITAPRHGAGETCAVCWKKVDELVKIAG